MKLPAFQFYPGDWIQDTRALSLSAKGAWIDILSALWRSSTRGSLTLPLIGWARLVGASVDQTAAAICELVEMRTCDSSIDINSMRKISSVESKTEITISNRRMVREEKLRQDNCLYQERYRDKRKGKADSKTELRPYSSSSSSKPPPYIPPEGGNPHDPPGVQQNTQNGNGRRLRSRRPDLVGSSGSGATEIHCSLCEGSGALMSVVDSDPGLSITRPWSKTAEQYYRGSGGLLKVYRCECKSGTKWPNLEKFPASHTVLESTA